MTLADLFLFCRLHQTIISVKAGGLSLFSVCSFLAQHLVLNCFWMEDEQSIPRRSHNRILAQCLCPSGFCSSALSLEGLVHCTEAGKVQNLPSGLVSEPVGKTSKRAAGDRGYRVLDGGWEQRQLPVPTLVSRVGCPSPSLVSLMEKELLC